jgi:hypothetical protein
VECITAMMRSTSLNGREHTSRGHPPPRSSGLAVVKVPSTYAVSRAAHLNR